MSKNLKDLINSVEEESQSHAELEKMVHSLKEEKDKLEFTVREQKLLIENLKSQLKNDEIEQTKLPSEVDVLKEIIIVQRKELTDKDNLIENLNYKLSDLSSGVEGNEESNYKEKLNEEFVNNQKLIIHLTEKNEQLKTQIEELQKEIEDSHLEEAKHESWLDDGSKVKEDEELINFKRLNFQLMEENGLLRVEIESLKSKFQQRLEEAIAEEIKSANEENSILLSEIESIKEEFQEHVKTSSEELEIANRKIEMISSELEDYEAQVKYLQDQLELTNEPVLISTEEALNFTELNEELESIRTKLLDSQRENQVLNQVLNELKKNSLNEDREQIEIVQNLSEKLPISLFYRIYSLLDDKQKIKVVNSLILDLKSNDNEIKRNAIRILSILKNNTVYNAFLEMLNDKDWLVRYCVIKALSKFEKKSEELRPILKKFSKDKDVDVRELALRILEDLIQ
ncbi:MAG: HEAT repeat domain-containing protein [Promethearchaeota archaeon]|nr:MAG: HEAT repeat domain-containing protein [Candidatus Lokiarchaeota archaeon]